MENNHIMVYDLPHKHMMHFRRKNLQEKNLETSHYECISVQVKEKAHLAFYGQ